MIRRLRSNEDCQLQARLPLPHRSVGNVSTPDFHESHNVQRGWMKGTSGRIVWFSVFALLSSVLLSSSVLMFPLADPAAAQSASTVDYDDDDDGLIDVNNLAQLNAIRWDLNGDWDAVPDNQTSYYNAFPNAAAGMGCKTSDHDGDTTTPDEPVCGGYELRSDLTFDSDGDGNVDGTDHNGDYWDGGAGWDPVIVDQPHTDTSSIVFEGNNHTIDRLFINRPTEGDIGLFGRIHYRLWVQNFNLTNVDVTGNDRVGALAGTTIEGIIVGIVAEGAVVGKNTVGGLVGRNHGFISKSNAQATVEGNRFVGGLVGESLPGGWFVTSIQKSYATGDVTANHHAGGLVGVIDAGSVANSYATGQVIGLSVIDKVTVPSATVGGLVGTAKRGAVVSSSYSTSTVVGYIAGGLVGTNHGTIVDSYAEGSVYGDFYSAGLVGHNKAYSSVRRSYTSAEVGGVWGANVHMIGGLIANSDIWSDVLESYWDPKPSRQQASADGQRMKTNKLKKPTGYSGIYADWAPNSKHIFSNWGKETHNPKDHWDFGTSRQYPALKVDIDGDGTASVAEFGNQRNNRAPIFSEGPTARRKIAEDAPANTKIGIPVSAVDPYGGSKLAYSIGTTTDDNHFSINSRSGQLKTKGALDYDVKNSYTVTISVTDGSLTDGIAVTIDLIDINDLSGLSSTEHMLTQQLGQLSPISESRHGKIRAAPDGSVVIMWSVEPETPAYTVYDVRRRVAGAGNRYRVILRKLKDNDKRDLDPAVGSLAFKDSDNTLLPGQTYLYGVIDYDEFSYQSKWKDLYDDTPAPLPARTKRVVRQIPTPAPTSTPTPVPTSTPMPAPTSTPMPAPTSTPTPAPTSTPTPAPTSTPTPVPTSTPTPAPTSTPTPAPTSTPTPVPTSTPTPTPTSTPTPALISATDYKATAYVIENLGQILVEWDAVQGADYYIVKKDATSYEFPRMLFTTKGTAAFDRVPQRGVRYEYLIMAYDSAGNILTILETEATMH